MNRKNSLPSPAFVGPAATQGRAHTLPPPALARPTSILERLGALENQGGETISAHINDSNELRSRLARLEEAVFGYSGEVGISEG